MSSHTTTRETFLQTVRQAVIDGNRAGFSHEVSRPRGLGYQGGGDDPVGRFMHELAAAGGFGHVVYSAEEALEVIAELLGKTGAKKIILDGGELGSRLGLREALSAADFEIWEEGRNSGQNAESIKQTLFRADVGITGVDYLVAETGSIILASKPGRARSLSLLPPVHIAVAERRQLLPDLFDSFDAWQPDRIPGQPLDLPACISIITGPSKTGDIELRLVTGVHGPGELHVLLIDR